MSICLLVVIFLAVVASGASLLPRQRGGQSALAFRASPWDFSCSHSAPALAKTWPIEILHVSLRQVCTVPDQPSNANGKSVDQFQR